MIKLPLAGWGCCGSRNTKGSTITKAHLHAALEHQVAQANVSRCVTVYKKDRASTAALRSSVWLLAGLTPRQERATTHLRLVQPLSEAIHRYLATFLCRGPLLLLSSPLTTWAPLGYQRLVAKLASRRWLPGYKRGGVTKHSVRPECPQRPSLRGSGRVRARHSKAVTRFHPPRTREVRQLACLFRLLAPAVPTTQARGALTARLFSLFSAPHLMTVTLTTITSHFLRK